MEKNQLKWYESPAVEVVEMEALSVICASEGSIWDPQEPADER